MLRERLSQALDRHRQIAVPQLDGAVRAHLAAELVAAGRRVILVGRDGNDAEALLRDLTFLLGLEPESASEAGLLLLAHEEGSPFEESTPDATSVMERLNTLYRLATEPDRVRAVVVSPTALVRKQVPPSFFGGAEYVLAGVEIERERLLERLARVGYNAVTTVEDPGTFSVRGGIIDIFSPHRCRPVRLDLFGDEVESIHTFDPSTQRNQQALEEAVLLPAREIAFSEEAVRHGLAEVDRLAEDATIPSRRLSAIREDIENRVHFFGIETLLPLFHPDGLVGADAYLRPGEDWVTVVSDPEGVEAAAEDLGLEARLGRERAEAEHRLVPAVDALVDDGAEVLARATRDRERVDIPQVVLEGPEPFPLRWDGVENLRAEILRATRTQDDIMTPVVTRLRDWRSRGKTTLVACSTRGQAERLRELLEPKNVQVRIQKARFDLPSFLEAVRAEKDSKDHRSTSPFRDRAVHAHIIIGELSSGYVLEDGPLAVLSEDQIFGQKMRKPRRRKKVPAASVSDLKDLGPGDFVVHADYGVGLYKGMKKLGVNGVESDYLHIEYKGKDVLYLPVHRLRLISKYVGASEGRQPTLDRLGGTTWAKTKAKVKDSLLKMAAELLRLYAVRASLEGHAFPPPDETYRQFEAEFPFEPTPDQQKAIDDVLADLQKPHPMDRLICGDVGYGKTEVAMRAVMHAVCSGKQVAMLVPTTVLAAQHYNVFRERFANFGVRIGIVSRFQPTPQIKELFAQLKQGSLDVIIGTHKLLSKEVQFADLGLLVIDEEHRFGVAHKEKLKKYRANVHVLAMSATPIPRSLHMGFMGVRDMSMIATAPHDRLAVKTEVHKFSEEVIREAILREIRRGGQAFVIHNRVSSMPAFAKFLERLVPEARIAVGHGQMEEGRLEKVMVDFMNQDFNVLLSTTIVESGIDIPNANTIIINRADTMGLAQLYQLKGRVGRSRQRGYAYFLIPAGNLGKLARRRIGVLQRFTELGAGFKVASQDLEIRGAGNILGKQQSGTISQVGFEMYQTLLKEAIAELRGSNRVSYREPEIQVPVPALLPDTYISDPGERLSMYQRLNDAETDEETFDLLQEMGDIYGSPPAEVEQLVQLMRVKQRMSRAGALGLDYGGATKTMPPRLVFRFDADAPRLGPDQIVRFVQEDPGRRKLTPEGKLIVHLAPFEEVPEILQQAKDLLDALNRIRIRAAV